MRSLWKAPEILRNPVLANGTPKGDVYSFGIVLFEMVGRSGPWGTCELSHEGNCTLYKLFYFIKIEFILIEIIDRVRDPIAGQPIFRPNLENIKAAEYIKHCLAACWEEDPEMRFCIVCSLVNL